MKLINIEEILTKLQQEVEGNLKSIKKKSLTLATILASNDDSSKKYIKYKTEKGNSLGIKVQNFFAGSEIELEKLIKDLNSNKEIDGILLQLPLSDQFSKKSDYFINLIDPKKDCDCLTNINLSKLFSSDFKILPATVKAIDEVLANVYGSDSNYKLSGKNITIINNSNLIGLPLAIFLSKKNGSVTILNKYSKDIKQFTRNSDIVITATGVGNLLDYSYFSSESILIDVTSLSISGKVIGDIIVDDNIKSINLVKTPVPGGIGPLTIMSLFLNLIKLQDQSG